MSLLSFFLLSSFLFPLFSFSLFYSLFCFCMVQSNVQKGVLEDKGSVVFGYLQYFFFFFVQLAENMVN